MPSWAAHAIELLAAAPHLREVAARGGDAGPSVDPEDLEQLARVKLDSLYYLSREPDAPRQRLYDAVWRVQRAALLELLDELGRAGVPTILFKGAEHLERFYRPHSLSFVGDFDVLVDRPRLVEVQRILYGLGYRPVAFEPGKGFVDRDIAELAGIEAGHYQLPAFIRLDGFEPDGETASLAAAVADAEQGPIYRQGERLVVGVECDVHHRVAVDVESEPLARRAPPSVFDGVSTLSPADNVWFTISRLYVEAALHRKTTLRDFAYLLPLLAEGDVDWSVVVATVEELDLRPHVYYFLSFLDDLLDGAVPPEVLSRLEPTLGDRGYDWGWQLGKLFSFVEPSPLPIRRAAVVHE